MKCKCCGKNFIPQKDYYILCFKCWKEEKDLEEFWADCYPADTSDIY